MNHLDFQVTPLNELKYWSKKWGVELLCKRDDLFAQAGGGSKARMLQYILYQLVENKIEVLITAGGPCSNYNRAAALLCAHYGIKMKLISYTDFIDEYETSLNHHLVKLAGADIIFCKKKEVPQTIQKVIEEVKSAGKSYQYLYGGGKSLEGVFAYYDAVKELYHQYSGRLDAVFVACGTGTTLTGICAGMQKYFPNAIVHAISTARTYEDEKVVLNEDMGYLNTYLNANYDFSNLCFHDEFLLGGYGQTSVKELDIIRECISKEGMLIDPTYSGKAFYGMSELLPTMAKVNDTRFSVLFWNTGGIFNLLSAKKLYD